MKDDGDSIDLTGRVQAELAEVTRTHMPFGRYGPETFPPRGVPLIDLPFDYLNFFAVKGFPKGRLGELLRKVYQTKLDGADSIFDEARRLAGGPTVFRKPRKRDFKF